MSCFLVVLMFHRFDLSCFYTPKSFIGNRVCKDMFTNNICYYKTNLCLIRVLRLYYTKKTYKLGTASPLQIPYQNKLYASGPDKIEFANGVQLDTDKLKFPSWVQLDPNYI